MSALDISSTSKVQTQVAQTLLPLVLVSAQLTATVLTCG